MSSDVVGWRLKCTVKCGYGYGCKPKPRGRERRYYTYGRVEKGTQDFKVKYPVCLPSLDRLRSALTGLYLTPIDFKLDNLRVFWCWCGWWCYDHRGSYSTVYYPQGSWTTRSPLPFLSYDPLFGWLASKDKKLCLALNPSLTLLLRFGSRTAQLDQTSFTFQRSHQILNLTPLIISKYNHLIQVYSSYLSPSTSSRNPTMHPPIPHHGSGQSNSPGNESGQSSDDHFHHPCQHHRSQDPPFPDWYRGM